MTTVGPLQSTFYGEKVGETMKIVWGPAQGRQRHASSPRRLVTVLLYCAAMIALVAFVLLLSLPCLVLSSDVIDLTSQTFEKETQAATGESVGGSWQLVFNACYSTMT
jgi:hypothetical protein